jgi:hypothetical protein
MPGLYFSALTAREPSCESRDMSRNLTLALLICASGCGGTSKPAATTTEQQHEGSAAPEEEHAEMPAELAAFHDLLAPRFHAAEGPQRLQDTCGAIEQFRSAADAVGKATPPVTANADTWTAGTRALVQAVDELATACTTNDVGTFDAAFTTVHERFEALAAMAGHHD